MHIFLCTSLKIVKLAVRKKYFKKSLWRYKCKSQSTYSFLQSTGFMSYIVGTGSIPEVVATHEHLKLVFRTFLNMGMRCTWGALMPVDEFHHSLSGAAWTWTAPSHRNHYSPTRSSTCQVRLWLCLMSLSFNTCTPIPCGGIWSNKQGILIRLVLGRADLIHQKGARGLFYISKRLLGYFLF